MARRKKKDRRSKSPAVMSVMDARFRESLDVGTWLLSPSMITPIENGVIGDIMAILPLMGRVHIFFIEIRLASVERTMIFGTIFYLLHLK